MGYENTVAANKRRTKHGLCNTKVYRAWVTMRSRCEDTNNKRYHRYGGRGIQVCDRWQSFEMFYADMGDAPEGASLDRINNDGNYEPGNCRWATPKQQQNNTSNNRTYTHDGKTQTLAQWARDLGIAYHVLRYRLNKGWQPPKLFTTDNLKGKDTKHTVEYEDEQITLKEASRRSGIALQTLYWRLATGKKMF